LAHHKSAKKRIRANERKRVINRNYLSAVKTSVKKFQKYLTTGTLATDAVTTKGGSKAGKVTSVVVDKATAQKLFETAQSLVAKAAAKGMLHRNTASRKISRLTKMLSKSAT
jgi:small subunit ribosomal protein S20